MTIRTYDCIFFDRLTSKASHADLDTETLTRLQSERADLVSTLNGCLESAQDLDDRVSALGVVVHTDSVSGPATELYDHTKKVKYVINVFNSAIIDFCII